SGAAPSRARPAWRRSRCSCARTSPGAPRRWAPACSSAWARSLGGAAWSPPAASVSSSASSSPRPQPARASRGARSSAASSSTGRSTAIRSSAWRRPMPEPPPADALERMRRQVRAVRWRQNLHELQRALYHLLATLAAAATALVVLALLCTPGLFAAAAWGLGAGSVLLAAWITRALGRRWLSGARTPLWIDRHARLEGRLATALELERHGGVRAPFFPLLVEDNARRPAAWR